MDKILELDKILDEEIDFCEKFEQLLLKKKELLVHSKTDKLKEFDDKIYDAQKRLQELSMNRINISKKFGNETMKLSEIITTVEDKDMAEKLENKRQKIKDFANKISVVNHIVNALIEHSLLMINGSINAIAKAMSESQTKGDYYNNQGIKEHQQTQTLSAIVEDA